MALMSTPSWKQERHDFARHPLFTVCVVLLGVVLAMFVNHMLCKHSGMGNPCKICYRDSAAESAFVPNTIDLLSGLVKYTQAPNDKLRASRACGERQQTSRESF